MYTYILGKLEARTDSLTPKIACLVQAYDEAGNMIKHESVIVDASEVDAVATAKTFSEADLTATFAKFDVKELDAIVAEREAKELATLQAQAIIDKVQVKLAAVLPVEEVIIKG